MTTYRRVLAIGEFRALLAAEGVTSAARTMQMLALSVLVYARTGSTLLAAVAYLAGFLPQAIGASTLLSLADRARPRLLLPVWDCAWAALAVLLALGGLPIWAMIVLVMLAGVVDAPVGACRNAVVVDAVPEEAYVLARSVLNLSVGFMQIVGFAVAGSLLTLIGPRTALLVGAGLALVSAVVQRTGLRDRAPRATGPASVATTMRGHRELLRVREIRTLVLAMWVPNGLIVGAEALFVPYAGGAAGLLFVAGALGMLAGDVVVGRFVTATVRRRLVVPLYALLAAPYLVFFAGPPLWVAAGLILVASVGFAAHLGLQERFVTAVPKDLLGQGFGLVNSGMLAMQAVAAAGTGILAETAGSGLAMSCAAAVSLLFVLVLAPRLWARTPSGPTAAGSVAPGSLASTVAAVDAAHPGSTLAVSGAAVPEPAPGTVSEPQPREGATRLA